MKETIEEAENFAKTKYGPTIYGLERVNAFKDGAKWQQEQMKAREIESPIVKQLLDETTPEQFNKINKEMSNNKQTSVEWLFKELLNSEPNILEWNKLLQQAKAMHKEEIMEAYCMGDDNIGAEQYYNETFGGNK